MMSDTNKDQDETFPEQESSPEDATVDDLATTDEATADEVTADEPEAEDTADDEDIKPAKEQLPKETGKRGNGVAWLALLLSAAALGAVGYTLYLDWQSSDADASANAAVTGLESQVATTRRSVTELSDRVDAINVGDTATTADVDAVRGELDERISLLTSLPSRMSTLESTMASLAGVSTSARNTWLLAEAEYYLQIANAQLQLANNPQLASMALSMADERVVQIADPALTDVRRAISDELAALDIMEKPDVAGATLTLASLARVVESLPLAKAAIADAPTDESIDAEQSGMDRAWTSMKSAVSGLVKVTPPEQEKLIMLTTDGEYFLRNNIALQLQSARLALLRGEQAVFEQSLDDTSALLDEYFDAGSAQVASTRETLAEVRSNVFTTSAPDISQSLRLLRQYRTLTESSQ
jgi:uroporphyrin-3 C-methyltransferase